MSSNMPDSWLEILLINAGYEAVFADAKGRYYQQIINLLGGIPQLNVLREEYIIRLCLNAQIRKGEDKTLAELKHIAQPRDHIHRFLDHLLRLLDKQLFFRGYRLRCPHCDLEVWYELSTIAEHITCKGCRNAFQMGLEVPFSYQPNLLFSRAFAQGALSLFLALFYFHQQTTYRLLWETNYRLKKAGKEIELDLVCLRDGQLIVVECKDHITDQSSTLEQLENGLKVATAIGASEFYFATLENDLPIPLQQWLQGIDGVKAAVLNRDLLTNNNQQIT